MLNSQRFLHAYNRIDRTLRDLLQLDRDAGFRWMVRQATKRNSTVRRYQRQLEEFGELRNAIVHDTVDSYVIAEPNDRAVHEIEMIDKLLSAPPAVYPLFKTKVLSFDHSEPLPKVVAAMHQHTISQVPIYDGDNLLGLLTSAALARWLGLQVRGDHFELQATSVTEVLEFSEAPDSWALIKRNALLVDVLDIFTEAERHGQHLNAVLITENAQSHEIPIGIITLSDLPQIYAELDITP